MAICDGRSAANDGNDDENEPGDQQLRPAVVVGGHRDESSAPVNGSAAATTVGRSGRQFYQPYAAYPQRRVYKGPPGRTKKRPTRTKFGRRPGPRRRPPAVPMTGRYKRLPPPRHVSNYVDTPGGGVDYADNESPSFDYDEFEHREPAGAYAAYGPTGTMAVPATAFAHVPRKRRPYIVDERAVVPLVRVVPASRPDVAQPPAAAAAVVVDHPMDKLRQMVHEAMDEHFANRHQELYADGFDKQQRRRPHANQVYSAKYKRLPDKQQQRATSEDDVTEQPSTVGTTTTAKSARDPDADGSDDRLTLAEISAYMGAKPAETVLSAGGHRYVLSDALQQSLRHQQQQYYADQRQQHYLRYVSPFEALYELPAARWAYR